MLRCAVDTRQSVARSEPDLTSWDVQRLTCESYVLAMQQEGWQLLDERLDDVATRQLVIAETEAELVRTCFWRCPRRMDACGCRR